MSEGHAEFPDGSVEIDTEFVCQLEHLALPDVDHDDRVTGVFTQNPLEPLDLQFVERRRGQPQSQRDRRAVTQPRQHGDRLADQPEP